MNRLQPRYTVLIEEADEQKRVDATEAAFERVNAPVRFLQCEPLLEKLTFRRWDLSNWLVIGPLTGAGKRQPEHEWVRILLDNAETHGCKVFMKPTLQIDGILLVQEYPQRHHSRSVP